MGGRLTPTAEVDRRRVGQDESSEPGREDTDEDPTSNCRCHDRRARGCWL